jgi:hypothetical protein
MVIVEPDSTARWHELLCEHEGLVAAHRGPWQGPIWERCKTATGCLVPGKRQVRAHADPRCCDQRGHKLKPAHNHDVNRRGKLTP